MHGNWSLHGPRAGRPKGLPSVVVVGAGMAGLVAARLLNDTGFPVVVLEARNRPGGRIWTERLENCRYDLGGSWIHDAFDNPLTSWCRSLGMGLTESPRGSLHLFEEGAHRTLWRLLRKRRLGMTAAALRFAPVYARSHLRNCLGLGDNLSMGLVFDRLLSRSRNRTDQRLLLWLLSMVEAMDAATAYDLSLAQWNFIDYCQTSFYPEESFEGLVCDAARGLDIRFSTEVSRLVYNDHNVTALTSKGSFSADMALVTVPLGVLKSGIPVFDPPLEMKKRIAIEGIGYGGQGVLNKIALEFPEGFWPRGCEKLGSLPLDAADRGVFNIWIDHERSAGAPLLVGFTNGAASAEMDRQCADEEILSKALQVLQRMFSREIPEPQAFRVTRWLSDPWARGSYSYASVGTREEHRRTLAAPVENRLYFAGEAAHKTHYGTVHGALLSGEREALRIHRLNCCGFTEQRHLPWH